VTPEAAIDAYRLPDLASLPDGGPQLDAVDAVLTEAGQVGVLTPLASESAMVQPRQLLTARYRTIRTRMHLLGFLASDDETAVYDADLRAAVTAFQAEAGLVTDGWVGPETWTALEELVSFEHPLDADRWLAEPRRSVVERAIQVRLRVLGCHHAGLGGDDPRAALDRFAVVAAELGLPASGRDLLALLFDQDALVAALGRTDLAFAPTAPYGADPDGRDECLRRFAVACAAVELWLLGHDVALDGRGVYDVPTTDRLERDRIRYPFFNALLRFWQQSGARNARRGRESNPERITSAFFARLAASQQLAGIPAFGGEELYRQLADHDEPDLLDAVWSRIKTIGSRIWDGVKRAWRWLTSLVGKALRKAANLATNLARLTYGLAYQTYLEVARVVDLARDAVELMLAGRFPGSDPDHLVVTWDADLDLDVWRPAAGDPVAVAGIQREFRVAVRRCRIGLRVLALLVRLIVDVVGRVVLGAGWFGLILALVRLPSHLRELRTAVAAADLVAAEG
jgi:hypothetical protein